MDNGLEKKLKSLQNDIFELSHRLTDSATPQDKHLSSANTVNNKGIQNASYRHDTYSKALIDGLTAKLEKVNKEKDAASEKLDEALKTINTLNTQLKETNSYKDKYEILLHDYDTMKISFESSERIRKQQKDLILILQSARDIQIENPVIFDSPTHKMKRIGSNTNSEDISYFNTTATSAVPMPRNKDPNKLSPSVVAENQEWLNSYSVDSPSDRSLQQTMSKLLSSTKTKQKIQDLTNPQIKSMNRKSVNNKQSSKNEPLVSGKTSHTIHNEHHTPISHISNSMNRPHTAPPTATMKRSQSVTRPTTTHLRRDSSKIHVQPSLNAKSLIHSETARSRSQQRSGGLRKPSILDDLYDTIHNTHISHLTKVGTNKTSSSSTSISKANITPPPSHMSSSYIPYNTYEYKYNPTTHVPLNISSLAKHDNTTNTYKIPLQTNNHTNISSSSSSKYPPSTYPTPIYLQSTASTTIKSKSNRTSSSNNSSETPLTTRSTIPTPSTTSTSHKIDMAENRSDF